MYQKEKDETPNNCSLSWDIYIPCAIHKWVCVNEEHNFSIYTLSVTAHVYPNKSSPLNWLDQINLGNNIILYSLGYYYLNIQWRLYLVTLWWPNTIAISWRRNKTSQLGYISKIHLEYSLKLQYFNTIVIFIMSHRSTKLTIKNGQCTYYILNIQTFFLMASSCLTSSTSCHPLWTWWIWRTRSKLF